jgi:Domain of unknown function (DUF4158)
VPGRIFTEPERTRHDGEADLIRYFSLSRSDLDLVRRQRGDHNRIGFALQLCALRYMGFSPDNLEIVSTMAVAFVAEQLHVSPAALRDYGARSQTRTEHLQQIQLRLGFRDATGEDFALTIFVSTDHAASIQCRTLSSKPLENPMTINRNTRIDSYYDSSPSVNSRILRHRKSL